MDIGIFDYRHLRGTNGDVLREKSKAFQQNKEWLLINKTPTSLHLYLEKWQSGNPQFFTILAPREKRKFSPETFQDRDQLYTYAQFPGTDLIPFLEPYMFREIHREVLLGAVEYNSLGGHVQEQASHWDVRGIWMKNMMNVPLNVYYKGNLAAQIGAEDGMSYMGGGSSQIYFSNGREGLNYGDVISFTYSLPRSNGGEVKLFDVTIDDEQTLNVKIGTVSGGMTPPNPDNSIYMVDRPVHTGITFYRPTGSYNTRPTNPYAPF